MVFGGSAQPDGTLLSDLWAWDGGSWQQLGSGPGPPARGGLPGMTYDVRRDRLVLIGGGGNLDAEIYSGTWEWNGDAWTRTHP